MVSVILHLRIATFKFGPRIRLFKMLALKRGSASIPTDDSAIGSAGSRDDPKHPAHGAVGCSTPTMALLEPTGASTRAKEQLTALQLDALGDCCGTGGAQGNSGADPRSGAEASADPSRGTPWYCGRYQYPSSCASGRGWTGRYGSTHLFLIILRGQARAYGVLPTTEQLKGPPKLVKVGGL